MSARRLPPTEPIEVVAPATIDPAFEGGRTRITEVRGRFVATDVDDVVGTFPTRREAARAVRARCPRSPRTRLERSRRVIRIATAAAAVLTVAGAVFAFVLLHA